MAFSHVIKGALACMASISCSHQFRIEAANFHSTIKGQPLKYEAAMRQLL